MEELENFKPESPRGVAVAAPESLTQQEVQIDACLRTFISNWKRIMCSEDPINIIRFFGGDDEVFENSEKAGRRES